MPNRIIKDSISTSDKLARLSDFEFRVWVGLITYVDDTGRGDARPAILKGRLFPLRERVTIKDVETALRALADKGCVSLYQVDGKPYFCFPSWSRHQRIRDVKPKYPPPPEAVGPQSAAVCGALRPESNPNPNPNPNSNSNPDSKARGRAALPRGQYGWVKLTEGEYQALLEELGEGERRRCIDYVDELAQSTGNKNRWSDWALVVRKCHRDGWGVKGGRTAPAQRPENIQAQTAEDMERMRRILALDRQESGLEAGGGSGAHAASRPQGRGGENQHRKEGLSDVSH